MLLKTPPQVSEQHLRRKLSSLYERRLVVEQLIRSLQAYQRSEGPLRPSRQRGPDPRLTLEVNTPL